MDLLELPAGASVVIGRDPLAAVTFAPGADRMVSRRHARVECLGVDGNAWRLEDLGSRNGVYVNGERVDGVVSLRHGDEVMLGNGGPVLGVESPRDVTPSRTPAAT